jgi:protein TonB
MNTATISGNDFLDILFNGRNKDYGAYELRRRYDQRVRNAIMGTASVALVIIGGYVLSNQLMASETDVRKPPMIATPIAPINPIADKPITPPPALPSINPPAARPTIRYTQPLIVRHTEISPDDVPPRMDEVATKAVGVSTAAGKDDGIDPQLLPETGTGVVQAPAATEREDRDKVFTVVEIMPSFPGGESALMAYLAKNTRYPQLAAENEIEGRIMVSFVVDYEGNIKDVKIVSDRKGGGLEEEAARVVKGMPKWKPGKQNGSAVSVLYSLPIAFHLNK